ncbi:MAG: hypothetical protein ABIH72_00075 [archaeon]
MAEYSQRELFQYTEVISGYIVTHSLPVKIGYDGILVDKILDKLEQKKPIDYKTFYRRRKNFLNFMSSQKVSVGSPQNLLFSSSRTCSQKNYTMKMTPQEYIEAVVYALSKI